MGIIGSIAKFLGYGKRVLKVTPDFLLGTSAEAMGPAMKGAKGSIFAKGRAGFRALEKDVASKAASEGNFFKRTGKNLWRTPKDLYQGGKAGFSAAKAAGKNSIWGAVKGVGKAAVKKMPFIGAALTLALEAPNIYKAFKEGGFKAGMKEAGGAGVELGCMAAGTAIGSAICPGVGTLVGGIIGSIVGMFARGKTYTEKQAEAEEAESQGAAQNNTINEYPQGNQYSEADIAKLRSYGLTDEDIAFAMQNGYTVQDVEYMLAQLAEEEKTAGQQQKSKTSTSTTNNNAQAEIDELRRQNELLRQQLGLNTTQQNPYQDWYNQYLGPQAVFNQPGLNNNPFNMTNPYTNDIFYQQLFGFNLNNPNLKYNTAS